MKQLYQLLAIYVCLALIALSVLCLVAIDLGARAAPEDPITMGFSQACAEKQSPCWNGIELGSTSMQQARSQLIFQGYQLGSVSVSLRYYYFYSTELQPGCITLGHGRSSNVVGYMRLYCMNHMTIGRFASRVVVPQIVIYRSSTTGGDTEYLTYASGDSLEGVQLVVGVGWHSASSPVSSIDLFAQPVNQAGTTSSRWHGFMPMWRYCRLEPSYPRCR